MKFPKLFAFFNRAKLPTSLRINSGVSGGTYVSEDTCMEVSAFYRGVSYISTQIAKLPWDIKDANNTLLPNHPVSYLLNVSPNPETTSFMLKLFLIQCAIIGGNGYCEIERTGDGRPLNLWPLNSRRVFPMRTNTGELVYRVNQGALDGSDAYLKPRDILIIRNTHTVDGIHGLGVIGYALNTLGISLGADKFANGLFANGGMPSGVLQLEGTLTPEAATRLKQTWSESHGGKQTGGTAVLENGLKYSPISHSPDVLQFLQSRKFSVTEIARFLGIPPTKLFDSDAAKFNNIEHSNLEVATDTLDTWARNLESEVDVKLLSGKRAGVKSELDLYSVFRGDMATRAEYFVKMMQVGAITPNQIRQKEGMAPYSGGDTYYISTNNLTPQGKVDELIQSQIDKNKVQPQPNTPPSNPSEPQNKLTEVDKAVIRFLENKQA